MIGRTNTGGGGGGLNFKAVGGTTAPTNPKENMIWVNTDQKITGWNFSATDPFNFKIASNAGDVVGTAGGITFTKKNDGKSIFAFVRNETFTIPLLVSDSQDAAVLVRSDGEEHEAFSFTYKDKIWYNTYPGLGMDLWDTATPKIENTTDVVAIKEYLVDMLEKAEGMVWIKTGESSTVEFNALKQNGLQVYPLKASQYISGAWVAKTPKTYQSGAWVDWITYLYNNGDECTNVTGGWSANGWTDGTTTIKEGTKNSDHILLGASTTSTTNARHIIATENKIKILPETKSVCVTATPILIAQNNCFNIVVSPTKTRTDRIANIEIIGTVGTTETFSLDVSDISGDYYVELDSWASSNTKRQAKIHAIWLE